MPKTKEEKALEAKNRYKGDPEFRQKIIDRAKERYWKGRPSYTVLTPEEKALLVELNSYPTVGPNCLGTGDPPCNVKLVEVDGQIRVKGALFLETWKKNKKRKC